MPDEHGATTADDLNSGSRHNDSVHTPCAVIGCYIAGPHSHGTASSQIGTDTRAEVNIDVNMAKCDSSMPASEITEEAMMTDTTHTCRTIGCDLPRDEEWHLLCPRCWEWVAPVTQQRVLTEYRKAQGSAAHFQACSDARREATEALRAAR